MSDEDVPPDPQDEDREPPEDSNVLVFKNRQGRPIAVPETVVSDGERAYRCYKERIKGTSWETIATNEGYPSATAAKADVDRYLALGRALVVESSAEDMLALEVSRLDALQGFLWNQAEAGHVPSAMAIRAIIMDRAKLTIDPDRNRGDAAGSIRTVVISGESYVQELQKAAQGSKPLTE